jgi:hypothetical protein
VPRSTRSFVARLGGSFLASLLVAVFAVGPALGASSEGHPYPCTDSFAKQVAIESGFAERAGSVNPNYENPQFWLATQTICADFDQDGNDEMVFTLGAMGGTDPWAFFDVPGGQSAGSTYSFPTIDEAENYPNHRLELVRVEGIPAIRDTRRLFKPRDAHCCPTGGELIRVIGFREGGYEVLESSIERPDGLHKARLAAGAARSAASDFLSRKFEAAWYDRNGGRLNCNRRLAFNVRRCDVAFQIGDSGWFGSVRVGLLERSPQDRRARIRYRIQQLDEYCAFVLHGPRSRCLKTLRGSTVLKF